ncbi:DegV family protein [Macrococcus equipercicus]|uniref:DegV family protein n=1 Tax=Macrococcus equipercicus TaxID=69967 RepID=A0A9Q9F2F3_9STAP|nr:DegV family protein [Macrococcus equipercicus]KAA1042450.1 DegV family protein [Macrococcus equipercicus]UTH14336.1 DegV family protein [Macrococcus equipercicus]
MSIAIITDSTAYLPAQLAADYDIHVIPLNVLFDGVSYKEIEELSSEEFYRRMKAEKELPTTSQPAIGDYVKLLQRLKDDGATDVIAVHLSSGISGTYQGAVTAGTMVDGLTVHAFDSEISCAPQGFFALRASEMKETHSAAEIIAELTAMKEDTNAYFLVDDLKNLQKGGRLTGAQAFIGSMLQVKPILNFQGTKIVPFDKVRTKKKAMKEIESLIEQFIGDARDVTACIIHANDEASAREWLDRLEAAHPDIKWILTEFGPVIGSHLGEKALGFGVTKRRLNI